MQFSIISSNIHRSKQKRTLTCLLYSGAAFFALLFGGFILFLLLPFPELDAFLQRDWSTRVYDRSGNLVQILALENGIRREYTALDSIPPQAIRIFIAAEDKDFFSHHGVDLFAVIRAMYQNITSGKRVSGASTITMQLARLIIPAQQRTLSAKLREAWNALRLERMLSKQQILELYLNSIPFGFQAEGITSAARTFFALPLAELTAEQLCCLAVIPRYPAGYNPLKHPEVCAEKAAELYAAVFLHEKQPLSAQDAEQVYAQLLHTARTAQHFQYPFEMPHYLTYLISHYKAGDFTQSAIETNTGAAPALPPEWHLTADNSLSTYIQQLLQTQLTHTTHARLRNGAVLVIENATGNILAWIGSNAYFDAKYNGQINGVTALNQSGSSTKPFLYALALEQAWKPSDIVPDIPMRFGRAQAYIPRNFNNRFNGPVRFRVALASSLNIPAVYLLDKLGMEAYIHKLEQLKFQDIRQRGMQAGLSLALGSVPVSLYELVRAFSVFPRDGIILPLRSFQNGGTADGFTEPEQVYSTDTARLICSILSDSAARAKGFGFSTTFKTPFPALFKTGTANQYQSLIALAASSAYTIGVWMGNFSGNTVIGKTGSSIPAAIARDVLLRLHRQSENSTGTPAHHFAEPEHWHREPVCALSGMPASASCPTTVLEYLPSTAVQSIGCCTWHSSEHGSIYTHYPEEYRRWFSHSTRHGTIANIPHPLRIISPANGGHFISSPDNRCGHIPLEVIGGKADTISVYYNGNAPFVIRRPFFAALPLEKGVHQLRVQCGTEEQQLSFTVETNE